MFHLAAYFSASVGPSVVNLPLGTPTDQMLFSQNNQLQMPDAMRLLGAYAGGDGLTDARINAPSLRRLFLPSLSPVSNTILPANNAPVIWYGDTGPSLEASEGVSAEVSRNPNAAAPAAVLLWLSRGTRIAAAGPKQTLLCTSAVTLVNGQWAAGQLTLSQALPAGTYQVVGMEAFGAGLLASRLVFLQGGLRPGVLAQQAVGEWLDPIWRFGNAGVLGQFTNVTLPTVEHLGVAAGTTQSIYLDLVKIGS